MDFSEDMNSIYLFLVIQFILFVFQNVCYLRIENFQYAEMISGSLTPYITTVGLYNENQELLAVAKLSQPLPTSRTTDTTIVINLDR
jgi:hypothetical protein